MMITLSKSRFTNPRFWMASSLLLVLPIMAAIIIVTKILGKLLTMLGICLIHSAEYLDDLAIEVTRIRKNLAWLSKKEKGDVPQ